MPDYNFLKYIELLVNLLIKVGQHGGIRTNQSQIRYLYTDENRLVVA